MRSLSHELVHHTQNCRGDFDKKPEVGEGYFKNDGYMREKEREAYEEGNMCFREWEEDYKTRKKPLQESIYYNEGDNSKMSYKNWRNQEVNDRLMESWGFKAPKSEVLTESVEIEEVEELEEGHGACSVCAPNPCGCAVVEEAEEEADYFEGEEDTLRAAVREAFSRALKN
jgi:hypothetical protein